MTTRAIGGEDRFSVRHPARFLKVGGSTCSQQFIQILVGRWQLRHQRLQTRFVAIEFQGLDPLDQLLVTQKVGADLPALDGVEQRLGPEITSGDTLGQLLLQRSWRSLNHRKHLLQMIVRPLEKRRPRFSPQTKRGGNILQYGCQGLSHFAQLVGTGQFDRHLTLILAVDA